MGPGYFDDIPGFNRVWDALNGTLIMLKFLLGLGHLEVAISLGFKRLGIISFFDPKLQDFTDTLNQPTSEYKTLYEF